MKRYTNKQLRAMSPEELEKVKEEALSEFNEAGKRLKEIINNKDSIEEKDQESE